MNSPHPYEPYRILHVDMDHPEQLVLPAENSFIICWQNGKPLAHCWFNKDDPPDSQAGYQKLLMDASRAAMDYYQSPLFLHHSDQPSPPVRSRLLSIIICTHNRPDSLAECIQALLQNSDTGFELIVVDNAPPDHRTRDVVSRFPGVRYLPELRKGLSFARNTGTHAALYPLIAFLDDDVIASKNWIETIRSSFDDPEIMAITGLILPYTLETPEQYEFEKRWSFNRGYLPITFDYPFFLQHQRDGVPVWNIGAGATMAFRREAFELVGGFDTRLGAGASGCSEDSECWYRLLANGWKCRYMPSLYAFHHHRSSQDSLRQQLFQYMRGHICALLIQYEKFRQEGNLKRLYRILPKNFTWRLQQRFGHGQADGNIYLNEEIRGAASGWLYYYTHRKDPGYSNPFFLPYAINKPAKN